MPTLRRPIRTPGHIRSAAPAACLLAATAGLLLPMTLGAMQPEPTPAPAPAAPAPAAPAPAAPAPAAPAPAAPVPETPAAQTPKPEPASTAPPIPQTPATPAANSDPIETEVTLRDGRTIAGEYIRKDSTKLWLRIAGIETPLSLSDVDRVVQLPSVEERYEQLRSSIEPKDSPGLVRLSQWLLTRKRYALALLEVDRALEADPQNAAALQQRTLVLESARIADAAKGSDPNAPDAGDVATEPVDRPIVPKEEWPFLSVAQINLIRVYEVDLKDPPKMFITRDTLNRFLDRYAGQGTIPSTQEGRDAFIRLRPVRQLEAMFSVRAREFYSEVRITENPASFKRLRDDVLRGWVINSCATTQCHGGTDAGRLQLIPIRPGSDEAVYTNFLILDRFRTSDGLALVDYAQPARSPLLQMALDPRVSIMQHPTTDGAKRWQPVFRSEKDDKFQRTVAWIKGMFQPRPEYPIEYTPPGASTAPPAEPQPR